MSEQSLLSRLLRRKPRPARADAANDAIARRDDAVATLRERAESGDAWAQLSLARRLERGEGVSQDYVAAERWLRLAAEQGLVPPQARLGEMYLTGMPAPGSETPAVLSRLDAGVSVESLFQRLFPDALVIAQDPQQAAHWHARAAQGGDAASQARLGHQHASGFGVERDFALAEHWFAAAAAQQNLAGALGLGLLYAGGYGGRAEHARALEWLELCMDRDNATAQMCLAILLLDGEGVTHDEVRALALLEHAAAAGQPAAMFHLGELYRRGRGVARSASQAEAWLRRAAMRGYLPARLSLVQLLRASPDADAKAIAAMCREAAELGDGEAQYLLGQMYLAGEGVARDPVEAARWFSKAADQNVTAASERLGALGGLSALGGQGLPLQQELHGAADWFHRAEVYGDNQGLYHLGTLQLGGLALPRDPQAACTWTQRAAERGSDAACLALGMLYAAGQLVEQNYTQAARWYGAAAKHGDALARYYLALLHLRGLGVAQDAMQGLSMLAAAADAGCIEAAWALHDQYTSGEHVARDAQAATRWLVRAAELGSPAAVCRLAQRLEHADPATLATLPAERVIEMLQGCATAGHAEAQAMLGLWYLRGKQLAEDQPLALAWITRAAQGGHALAQAVLGDMLVLGLGVAVDADAAALWYERAALQGHAGAITALSSLRMTGGGVGGGGIGARGSVGGDQKSQVFQLWLRAAEQGHAGAQRMVGQFYLRGIGTPISQAEGRRWLAAASRQGDAGAMVLLGGQLLGGPVLQPTQAVTDPGRADDQALAAEMFRRAAARGNIDAHYNLGECLRLGIGVPRDDAKAERLYAAAAQRGHVLAQQALVGLKARNAGAVVEPGADSVPEQGEVALESG